MVTLERSAPRVALPPIPQVVWGRLAVVNFTCGGAGAGAVLGILAVSLVAPVSRQAVQLLEIIGLLLAGGGLAAVGAEAGRPLRGYNVFRGLRRSWMSREALAAAAFGTLIGLDVVLPGPWQRGLGAAAAFAFMLSQGFILFTAKGVPAWATWEVPLVFATSGLATGLGVVLVVLPILGEARALAAAAGMATAAVLFSLLAWWVYSLSPVGPRAKQEALAGLRTRWVGLGIVGVGHTLSLAVLIVALWLDGPQGKPVGMVALLAGLCMAAGGTILKWAVVRRAGLLHSLGVNVLRSVGRPATAAPSPGPPSVRRASRFRLS